MHSRFYAIGLMLAFLLPLCGQVTVEVDFDQDQFLAGETLMTAARIVNRSGQTLHLGAEPDWLTFSVEGDGNSVVAKNDEVPVLGEFALESSKVATRRADLAPCFRLERPGHYTATATVRLKEWDTQITSKPRGFYIIQGAKLWSREIGVPSAATNLPPEVRKYTLVQANYSRSQIRLYVRVTDADDARLFKVFSLGQMVSFNRPDPQLDKESNLHVLHQSGARSFTYNVVNPDGEIILRQTHDYAKTRPRLQADEEGHVKLVGGSRRPLASDVPAPKTLENEVTKTHP